ncbi:methyltransferase family protein [Sunxiuqinia sp. A32]|uniref:methyltransferase family protein n=1 Tax=Sunxiuqinia sp. A32 TaxID=3461496 RepID=UPI0040453BC9
MNLIQIALITLSGLPIVATFLLAYQLMRNGQGAIGRPTIHPIPFFTSKFGIGVIICLIFWVSINPQAMFHFPFLIQNEIIDVQKLLSLIFLLGANLLLVPAYVSLSIFTRVGLPASDHALNTSGVYRISRNPMYTSFFFFHVACFLLIPSVLLLGMMLFISITHHFIILKEENFLENTFRSEYLTYKKSTARYL